MKRNKTQIFTQEQLNNYSRDELVETVMMLQNDLVASEEKLAILQERMFGRKTEVVTEYPEAQLSMVFNDAEAYKEVKPDVKEPTEEEVITYARRKRVGKRDEDLKDLPTEVIEHNLTEEELNAAFKGEIYTRLPDEIYRKLRFTPAQYVVEEHHIATYKCQKTNEFVRADRPADVIRNSIATPSLVASIMNGKYTQGLPLYRMEQELERSDIHISRQNMAHWIIKCSEMYLSIVYDKMHKIMCEQKVLQADETPCLVSKDGRDAGTKSYMWVYRTSERAQIPPIILYDYEKTRSAQRPKDFLKDFNGTLMCDGFDAYPALERQKEDFQIANCYAHARRPFANAIKALKMSGHERGATANKALSLIQKIYRAEEKLNDLSPEERLERRRVEVAPHVEAYFAWVKMTIPQIAPQSAIGRGLAYSLSREKYLKRFLENGEIPIDNSASERSIRPFTIGRKNWIMIDTIYGADASAVVYSLVETAKANNLNIYSYLEYLLTEIPKHDWEHDDSYIEDLLPWSDKLPVSCKR